MLLSRRRFRDDVSPDHRLKRRAWRGGRVSPWLLAGLVGCSHGGADTPRPAGVDLAGAETPADLGLGHDAAVPRDLLSADLALVPSGSVGWSTHFPVNQTDYRVVAVAVDSSGNVLVVGSFQGAVDFGGGLLTSAGQQDAFVVKLDAAGRHLWSRRYGGPDNDWASGVVTGAADVVAITGAFAGSVDFGRGPLTSAGVTDIFLLKLDAGGSALWSKGFGSVQSDDARSVAMAKDGSLAIAGRSGGPVDFGGGPHGAVGLNGYAASFAADGRYRWSVGTNGRALNATYSVALDGNADALIGGYLSFEADYGGGPRYTKTTGDYSAYLVKYAGGSGGFLWDRVFQQSSGNQAINITTSVAADSMGAVAVVGQFDGTLDFGSGPLSSMGTASDVFVVRAGADGKTVAARRFGGSEYDTAQSVAFVAGGDLVVAGRFRLSADFGRGALSSAGGDDAFIARYDRSLTARWTQRFGGPKSDIAHSVAVGPDGSIVCAGTFQDTVDFGAGPVTAVGQSDIFVVKLNP